jgi:hypothetical protein
MYAFVCVCVCVLFVCERPRSHLSLFLGAYCSNMPCVKSLAFSNMTAVLQIYMCEEVTDSWLRRSTARSIP